MTLQYFSKICKGKFRLHCNITRITGTLREDLYAFIISRWFLLRMGNVSDKICLRKIHILCPVTFFRNSCCLWDNVELWYSRTGHRWQQDACALRDGRIRLQTHSNMYYLLLFTAIMFTRKRLYVMLYVQCLLVNRFCGLQWLNEPWASFRRTFYCQTNYNSSYYICNTWPSPIIQVDNTRFKCSQTCVSYVLSISFRQMSQSTTCYLLQEHFHCQREASTYIISLPVSVL